MRCALLILLLPLAVSARAEVSLKTFLQDHCVRCHGAGDELQGDVNLASVASEPHGDVDLLADIIDVVELREMPPEDESQPTAGDRQRIVDLLKRTVASLTEQDKPRETPIRRMNRFQYNNAVTDLFDLNCTVFTLPERMVRVHKGYFRPETGEMADLVHVGNRPLGKSQMIERRLAGVTAFPQDLRAEHGFDNRADHLSMSPLLAEAFLRLGRSIVDSPDFGPKTCGVWKSLFEAPRGDKTSPEALEPVIAERLQTLLRRAFRRPPNESEVGRYLQYTLARIGSGQSFEDAMKSTAAAVIASPKFYYLHGSADEGSATAFTLASRLSFFLWGSLPDDELLELASSGKLADPAVLSGQVDRMLNDAKVKRFCDSFPSQWLQLERLVSSTPNRERFPDFYFLKYRTSMHMMMEPLLVFETVLIENRPITELIDSDFSYRSDALDQLYYGGENRGKPRIPVTLLPFKRVKVEDRRQGGVVTTAAVMTMTSGTERTKPITRGAWLATVIFNNPPDPPPADVPPLPEGEAEDENRTVRERLAAHREHAACSGCHAKIDPLGFALENYGVTGRWRDQYDNGREVDMDGMLFGQHAFGDIAEFKDAILKEKTRFAKGFASHLLSFALARELDARDRVSVDQIVDRAAADELRLRNLLKELVLSDSFRAQHRPADTTQDLTDAN